MLLAIQNIDYEKCNHCNNCYRICPMDVFKKIFNLVYVAYRKDCMSCFLCEMECPKEAIKVNGQRAYEIPFPY